MKPFIAFAFVISLQTCISNTTPLNNSEPIWEPQTVADQELKKAYFA